MSGTLYIVGTPIGNLGDFSQRAAQILSEVDFIAAEDTRVTIKLLNKFEIKNKLFAYHEHNKGPSGNGIIERLLMGESGALVSDAGMPAISDPGEDLVRLAHENGIHVEAVPGPSAVVTALAISGMPAGRFCFEGFLSTSKTARSEHLNDLKNERRTMVFYEAPHKLARTLKDMLAAFGDREIALIKELTKLHETVERTTFCEAVLKYNETVPRGEFVLIIAPAAQVVQSENYTIEQAVCIAQSFRNLGESASSAAKLAAEETGLKKGDIYRAML